MSTKFLINIIKKTNVEAQSGVYIKFAEALNSRKIIKNS